MTEPAVPAPAAATAPDGLAAEERRARAHVTLLAWYAVEGRAHLPWRHTRDPYAILVSEVMLQQTQVERVLPKYEEFLARFPTLAALAAAPTGEVIRAWSPLGYNVRAVRLQAIAQQAVARPDGALPDSLEGLLALKGIGRYTAGAVACFAFGLPVATVDTNIRRVLWRVFRGIEPARWPAGEAAARAALALAEWALPPDRAYDWQQALMDHGATICLSRRPACERCPLSAVCAAYAETARETLFPSGEALARLREERAAHAAEPPPDGQHSAQVAERRAGYGVGTPRGGGRRAKQQIPFTSTTRYFRGRILDALRALPAGESLALAALGPRIKPDFTAEELPWLRALMAGLARDGLARLVDVKEGAGGDEERVALP
ncbi:MAG TPA: A/G-specific adenine glycosylase [Ktedonobacterales bacterium]